MAKQKAAATVKYFLINTYDGGTEHYDTIEDLKRAMETNLELFEKVKDDGPGAHDYMVIKGTEVGFKAEIGGLQITFKDG